MSIVLPGSHCPNCKTPIKWFDNIPLLSFLWLRGKCRTCHSRISIRYWLIELLTAVLFVVAGWKIGYQWFLLEVLYFLFAAVCCTFIDIDHFLLPDIFTLSGIAIGLLGAWLNPERSFWDALTGACLGYGILWSIATLYYLFRKEEGMGGGDLKLLAWIGALLGWKSLAFVILSSSLIGSVFGIAWALRKKSGMKTAIPFGPYLVLGSVLWIFGADTFGLWYLRLFFPF